MNPLTNVKNINKLNEVELSTGLIHKKSWHDMYKGSAWIFIGGLEYGLTEGDVITVFSQYGEVVNINLVRDKKSGKSKGYCFLCFANQKSTVLAVDNLNGIKLCNRTIRVDHVADYKPPKENEKDDEITKILKAEGCAPKSSLLNESSIASNSNVHIKKKKSKKEKKKKKKRKHDSDENNSENDNSGFPKVKVKKEKHDAGYDKYDTSCHIQHSSFSNANRSRTEKRNHQGGTVEDLRSASSQSRERSKSNRDQNVHERSSRHDEDQSMGRHRSRERSCHESERRGKYKEFRQEDQTKYIKRERSSSSEGSSKKHKNDVRDATERRQLKSRQSDSKRREKHSSSSSSDQDSSSQSSSDDERNKSGSKNYKSDQYKNYDGKKEESRHDYRHVPRSKSSEFSSSKKYDGREKYSDYNAKDKYESNDRHDSHNRDSYYKYKHDKR